MGDASKAFQVSVLNLAVHGYIIMDQTKSDMKLIKTDKELGNDVSQEEKEIYRQLDNETTLKYNSSLQRKIALITSTEKKRMKDKFDKKLYSRNAGKLAIAIVISIISILISLLLGNKDAESLSVATFITVWLSIWTISVANIFKSPGIVIKLIGIPFYIGEFIGIGFLISTMGLAYSLLLLCFIVVNIIYGILIKAYTVEGREVKDEIEGFELFIKTASEEEILQQTPETFDKYFPYAYILGLENEWAKKFEGLLAKEQYEPTWCTGAYVGHSFVASSFTRSFSSSFNSSISSASTSPGSSSGGGGGGCSGGGGRRPEAAEAGKKRRHMPSFYCSGAYLHPQLLDFSPEK